MKLIEDLKAHAAQADKMMGELATDERKRMAREEVYQGLQREFEQMCEDGYLTKDELEEMMNKFRSQGLDTATLQELLSSLKDSDRVKATYDVRDRVKETIDKKKNSLKDPEFNYKAQVLMSEYNESINLAATIQKSEHEKYMSAIRHLVA